MNKRPLGPTGLPAKPGNPGVPHHQAGGFVGTPGPAPPLPPGPMPQQYPQHQQPQQGYQQQQQYPQQQQQQYPQQQQQQAQGQGQQAQAVDPAAHAAAWAAYYQATGQPNPYVQSQPAIGTSPNPANAAAAGGPTSYANYGYGAGATHANHLNPGAAAPGQQQNAQAGQAYGAYQYPQQPQQPATGYPPQGGQAPGYNYGAQPQQQQQAYRPPVQPQQAGYGYNSPAGPAYPAQSPYPQAQQQQPYYPQPTPPPHQQGFRPGMNPSPIRPYQPRPPGGPGPGMGMSPSPSANMPMGGQGGVPPAKRPRFDGPSMNPPARIINNGQPGFAYPNQGQGQPGFMPSGSARPPAPIHLTNMGVARPPASLPAAPIVRPPIHLGMGGPPPPGIVAPRGPAFVRGGARGGRGGAVHVPGAPRGPAGMGLGATRGRPTPVPFGSTRRGGYAEREREEREREREKRREKDRGPGTTMTDFRIVGIQIRRDGEVGEESGEKGEEWKWGWVEDEATALHPKIGDDAAEAGTNGEGEETQVKVENGDSEEVKPATEVKVEAGEANGAHEAEEKRGEKRKAKTPDIEEEPEGSSKKRAALATATDNTVESTHPSDTAQIENTSESQPQPTPTESKSETVVKTEAADSKPDLPPKPVSAEPTAVAVDQSAPEAEPTSKFEEPQNRFRIYFESPPELDRIPKAIRRGSNKRWRRESSSVAPGPGPGSAVAGESAVEDGAAVEEIKIDGEQAVPAEPVAVKEEDVKAAETEAVSLTEAGGDAAAVPDAAGESTPPDVASATEGVEDASAAPEGEDVGDVSMRTSAEDVAQTTEDQDEAEAAGDAALASPEIGSSQTVEETAEVPVVVVAPSSPSAETPATTTLPDTADTTAPPSTATVRSRRPSSVSTHDEHDVDGEGDAASAIDSTHDQTSGPSASTPAGPQPSVNRLSILYEESSRRICVDAEAVESVRIYRAEGKIEVCLKAEEQVEDGDKEAERDEGELRKGVLMEMYDSSDERFVGLSAARLAELYPTNTTSDPSSGSSDSESIPPLHHTGPMTITVWLNKKRPLSEPKWCRTNSADEWLYETFSARRALPSDSDNGWRGKLHVVDPDPAPTLASILSAWSTGAMSGTAENRRLFITSLTATNDPADLLEILLRLARGDRNPTLGGGGGGGFGNLAGAIRPDSPFASHQTHVSLAVLQMYRLTMVYADKAGEGEAVREKVEDIVRSLPVGMIQRSLDGLFREWTDKRVIAK